MSAHEYHPREGDPDAPVLFDDCPRCREHAERGGLDLDGSTFERAWRWMVAVERSGRPFEGESYRSENEALLCQRLYEMALLMERNMDLDPWAWPPRYPREP